MASARRAAALVLTALVLVPDNVQSQETLLGPGTAVQWGVGPEIRAVQVQGDLSTSLGFTVGATVNRSFYAGFAMGANFSHPSVNHSYAGLVAHYNAQSARAVHYGADLFLGVGSAKDYAREKSNAFDDFGNTSGPGFTLMVPGVHVELNLSPRARLYSGLGYRLASGLDEADPLLATTGVTASDLSGLSFNLGVRYGAY